MKKHLFEMTRRIKFATLVSVQICFSVLKSHYQGLYELLSPKKEFGHHYFKDIDSSK